MTTNKMENPWTHGKVANSATGNEIIFKLELPKLTRLDGASVNFQKHIDGVPVVTTCYNWTHLRPFGPF